MEIGPYLRRIRQEKGYTITEVAHRLGVSVSLLSQVENGKVSPSLQSLEELLRFYAINFSDFFRQVEQKRFIHVRREESERMENETQGVILTVLASKLQNNALESFIVELLPCAEIEVAVLGPEFNGERILYLLSGLLGAELDGGEALTIEEGGSVNFKSFVPCMITNRHPGVSRFLIAGLPPVFL